MSLRGGVGFLDEQIGHASIKSDGVRLLSIVHSFREFVFVDCLKCKKEIVETTTLEDGSGWMKLDEEAKFKHDGENEFVSCPFCGAKNVLSNVPPGPSGAMRFMFTSYE
jgi:DNA-directed RNA polymerase subunit RPC12/RpoP